MTGILLAPMLMGTDATFSTSTFEPVFWMTVALATIELARLAGRGVSRWQAPVALWWVLLGVTAGLGLENKWNEVFLTSSAGGAVDDQPEKVTGFEMVRDRPPRSWSILILPNLLWEMHHQWSNTLELLPDDPD